MLGLHGDRERQLVVQPIVDHSFRFGLFNELVKVVPPLVAHIAAHALHKLPHAIRIVLIEVGHGLLGGNIYAGVPRLVDGEFGEEAHNVGAAAMRAIGLAHIREGTEEVRAPLCALLTAVVVDRHFGMAERFESSENFTT